MGCCSSTPSASSSPHPAPYDDASLPNARGVAACPPGNDSATAGLTAHAAPGPASSRRNIATPTDSPRVSSYQTSHEQERREAGPAVASPGGEVPNRPLKPPPARNKVPIPTSLSLHQASLPRLSSFTTSADDETGSPAITGPIPTTLPRITRSQLERERIAFFATRWAGRAEAWAAVRLVCESMQQGDLAGAQTVLDAAGLTCPSGEVWSANADMPVPGQADGERGHRRIRGGKGEGGVYDEWGERYQVPLWIIADPEDVEEDAADDRLCVEHRSADDEGDGPDTDDEDEDDIILSKEKGKAPESGKSVKIKARLSDRGTDVVVRVGFEESVAALRRRIKESAELPPRSRIKIVYLGRVLSPAVSLSAQGWREGHVVNAMVFHPS